MKNVMISEELFFNLVKYFCNGNTELQTEIRIQLMDKLKRIADRAYYTDYKTAKDPEIRQDARNKYLDSKGVPEDFRY